MSTRGASSDIDLLRARLAHYRDHPTHTTGVLDEDLTAFHQHLLKQDSASNAGIHWFCSNADAVTKEAATFLLRLHVYNNGERVTEWRKLLHKCLKGCSECVRGLQENRLSSIHTYVICAGVMVQELTSSTDLGISELSLHPHSKILQDIRRFIDSIHIGLM